jgi:hypothetical protein
LVVVVHLTVVTVVEVAIVEAVAEEVEEDLSMEVATIVVGPLVEEVHVGVEALELLRSFGKSCLSLVSLSRKEGP